MTKLALVAALLAGPVGAVGFLLNNGLTDSELDVARATYSQIQESRGEFLGRCEEDPNLSSSRNACLDAWSREIRKRSGTYGFQENIGLDEGRLALLTFFGGIALAGSLIGSDWASGQIATTAQWEPRRRRHLTAETLAAAAVISILSCSLLFSRIAFTIPVAFLEGSFAGLDGIWWEHFVRGLARYGITTLFAAVGGVALATVSRGSVVPLVVSFGLYANATVFYRYTDSYAAKFQPGRTLLRFLGTSIGDQFIKNNQGELVLLSERSTWEYGAALMVPIIVLMLIASYLFRASDMTTRST